MAVAIDTSTDIQATEGRSIAVDSTGRIWTMHYSLADTRYEFWYSDDEGANWTEATSLRFTVASIQGGGAFYINTINDRAVFCYSVASAGGIDWQFTQAITSSSTWTAGSNPMGLNVGTTGIMDIVTFDKPSSSNWYMAMLATSAGSGTYISILEYTSGGTYVGDRTPTPGYVSTGATASYAQRLDFRHTGGETASTVASSSPDLFLAIGGSTGLVFYKLSYSAGTWTISTTRTITSDGVGIRAAIFDGTRFVMAVKDNSPSTDILVYERDAADTTTTTRTPPSLSGNVTAIDLSYDTDQNIYLFAVDDSLDDVWYVVFNRIAGTWGSWTKLEATTATATSLSVTRGHPLTAIGAVWTSGSGSPYTITYEGVSVNVAPSPATWESPANNSAQDRGAALVLDWAFNDTSTDYQSAYHLSRSINGGSLEYYNAGAGTWSGTETKNTSATTSVTLASGWATDGDSVEYKVRTYDKFDVVATAYSSGLTILASVPVTPVLTAPTDTGTITTSTVTATWTATEQTARRLRVLSAADAPLWDSGKVTSTVKTVEADYVLTDGETYKVEVRVWNDDDLVGATDTHTFDVDFTEPATPTIVVTAQPDDGRISIVVTDPTPGGSEPTVDGHDLFVRVASGGRQDLERPVGGSGIRIIADDPATTLYDYAAGSGGIGYEYRVRSKASSNGTYTDSAWTGGTVSTDALLLETGDALLLETGDALLLDA